MIKNRREARQIERERGGERERKREYTERKKNETTNGGKRQKERTEK